MKLAIAQMVFGGLIIGDCVWVWWVSNTWLVTPMLFIFYKVPFYKVPFLPIFLVLGLAVLGCGIAQYLKARRC